MTNEELKTFFKYYGKRLGKALFFFHYYIEMGRGIERYRDSLRLYGSLFPVVYESLFKVSVIEIAKFFDEDARTFSLRHLFTVLESNLSTVNSIEFRGLSNTLIQQDPSKDNYQDITQSEIQKWREDLLEAKRFPQIDQIRICRDKYEAHDDKKKLDYEFSHDQVIEIGEYLGAIIDRIPVTSVMHWRVARDAANSAELFFNKLVEGSKASDLQGDVL